jgi:hypothetical protein
MLNQDTLTKMAVRLPGPLKSLAKEAYYRGKHWAQPDLKQFGTVQDLYYWTSEDDLDTLLLLQNYFSALYPSLDTGTEGVIRIYDPAGALLGIRRFSLAQNGCAKFRVSSLLQDITDGAPCTYGTLEVHIDIPRNVLDHIRPQKPFYFWDRFYIGYVNARGHTCFVHGVDKTHIYHDGNPSPADWYKSGLSHEWAPEMPLNIAEYARFSVIMLNRTSETAAITLSILDVEDNYMSWTREIPAKGVHRFILNGDEVKDLIPTELRMRIYGMTTAFGRPAVFKEFRNGAMSAMHC